MKLTASSMAAWRLKALSLSLVTSLVIAFSKEARASTPSHAMWRSRVETYSNHSTEASRRLRSMAQPDSSRNMPMWIATWALDAAMHLMKAMETYIWMLACEAKHLETWTFLALQFAPLQCPATSLSHLCLSSQSLHYTFALLGFLAARPLATTGPPEASPCYVTERFCQILRVKARSNRFRVHKQARRTPFSGTFPWTWHRFGHFKSNLLIGLKIVNLDLDEHGHSTNYHMPNKFHTKWLASSGQLHTLCYCCILKFIDV